MDVLALLTAFGLGTVVTTIVQAWLSKRTHIDDRKFLQKREAYIGLLEAYHKAAIEASDSAAKNFAYWQMRCDLVGSQAVREAVNRIIETNDDREGRSKAHQDLKEAMRADLRITT